MLGLGLGLVYETNLMGGGSPIVLTPSLSVSGQTITITSAADSESPSLSKSSQTITIN